jgi:hypothetical protein
MAQVTLNQVADHIEAHPWEFTMLDFGDCGTAGCVAWHAAKLAGLGNDIENMSVRGERALGLPIMQAKELFLAHSIPSTNNLSFINKHARHVPAALRWMAENEIDWAKALAAVGVELPA